MKPSEQLRPGADAITALIAGTRPDQLGLPTPCEGWDVRALLNHLVGGAYMFAAAFTGAAPAGGEGGHGEVDLLGNDPSAAWQKAVETFIAGVDAPGALEKTVNMPWGSMPGAVVYEMLKFDVMVHAWDLSRATGQTFDPPAEVVEVVLAVARQMIRPEMRDGKSFGPEVTPPADARPIDRLAAFTGRSF